MSRVSPLSFDISFAFSDADFFVGKRRRGVPANVEPAEPRLLRHDLHGHHHAHARWRVGDIVHSTELPSDSSHCHDIEHSSGRGEWIFRPRCVLFPILLHLLLICPVGMNGVLAKPFTKDGMYKSVRSHLGHLMKNPPLESDLTSGGGYFMGNSYLNPTPTLKYEAQTPPANNSTWSPGLGPGPMGGGMEGYGFLNGGNQYTMATGHRPNYSQTMQSANSSSGHLSDVDSPPEKRQRLNPNY